MAMYAEVRRMKMRDGLSISEIARRTSLSRNTIKAWMKGACEAHSNGLIDADVTVQCCWDADRLDRWRVGVRPRADYLCTDEAKRIASGGVD